MMYKLDFLDGKYSVVLKNDGKIFEFYALRYGEEWKDLVGDNLALAMADRIDTLEQQLAAANARIAELEKDLILQGRIINGQSEIAKQLEQQLAAAIAFAPTDIAYLLTEVKRLNRMVDVSCKALSDHGIGCPLCIYSLQWDCDAECEVAKNEETCWRKYLEEAAGNG